MFERGIGQRDAAQIGNTFANDLTASEMDGILDRIAAELIDHALRALLKILKVRRTPPIGQITLRIELCTVVVETMRHLVANDRPDCTVIKCFVTRKIEKRRLQDTGREYNLVHR